MLAEAVVHHQQGRLIEAESLYRQVVEAGPDAAAALGNLGAALRGQGKVQEAIICYRRALALEPTKAPLHFNLGNALRDTGDSGGAADAFRRALEIDPEYVEALNNLGDALSVLNRSEEAVDCFERALRLAPQRADILNNLGNALKDGGRATQALDYFRRALEIAPATTQTLNNQGNTFLELGSMEEAEDCFRRSLAIDPANAEAHCLLSFVLLDRGDLARGWAENEWRWRLRDYRARIRHFPFPAWDGSPLRDKSILLWSEQGIGDEVCFAGMVADVGAIGARCAIECEPRLVGLFARSFPAARVHARPFKQAETGEATFDYQLSMGNLHRFFRTSVADFPQRRSFLVVDEGKRARWRDRLSALGRGPKIGLSWRSSLTANTRRLYFARIKDLKPLFTLGDTIFVNLQYDECSAEIAEARERFGAIIHTWGDTDLMNDIDGGAALTSCLDAVVTPITSVYEISGALGVPTHAFHPFKKCDVSFGTDGIPYYPSVRLHRQKAHGDWGGVFEDIATALS